MHEYSIVGALVDQVDQQARLHAGATVRRLHVRIGELSGVDVGLLQTAYDTFRPRTVCEDAAMEIELVPAEWRCPRCARSFARGERLRCEACARPAQMTRGDEIVLARIEMEVADV